MQNRIFGRTGHASSIAIFGGAAFWQVSQADADDIMEKVIAAGVNHIDIAPSYGISETRLGHWLPKERHRFFLGCKTQERSKDKAAVELRQSLKHLKTDHFDLYQLHAITTFDELDEVTRQGGALSAIQEAQKGGLTRFIGITGHGFQAPAIFMEALRRFDFHSVLFPINYQLFSLPKYRQEANMLLKMCQERQVGVMAIKSITKGPWGDRPHTFNTWYEPFTDMDEIQNAVDFALSQSITGICTSGDIHILPLILQACQNYTPMDGKKQADIIHFGSQLQSIF